MSQHGREPQSKGPQHVQRVTHGATTWPIGPPLWASATPTSSCHSQMALSTWPHVTRGNKFSRTWPLRTDAVPRLQVEYGCPALTVRAWARVSGLAQAGGIYRESLRLRRGTSKQSLQVDYVCHVCHGCPGGPAHPLPALPAGALLFGGTGSAIGGTTSPCCRYGLCFLPDELCFLPG